MSKQNANEILEEQRKARQEFLELKKMQQGEMEAPPKPSEVAILPKTPREKWENFWFQYKWHIIAITAITVVLAVMITQCATRKRYDMEVVLFSYHLVLDQQSDLVGEYLSEYAQDINGDGEVNVQVINCSFDEKSGNVQYKGTMLTKLQAMIAGDENALLFITDEESASYLNSISEDGLLEGEPFILDEGFYEATKSEEFGELPKGLRISCRRVSNTVLEKQKGTVAQYKAAQKLLKALAKQ